MIIINLIFKTAIIVRIVVNYQYSVLWISIHMNVRATDYQRKQSGNMLLDQEVYQLFGLKMPSMEIPSGAAATPHTISESYQAQAWPLPRSRVAAARRLGVHARDDATGWPHAATRCHQPASPPAAAAARPASPRSSGEAIRSRRRGGRGIRCYKRMTMTTRTSRCAQSL